jgi:hypothetical protein
MPSMPPSCGEGPRRDWFEDERLPSDQLKNASGLYNPWAPTLGAAWMTAYKSLPNLPGPERCHRVQRRWPRHVMRAAP